MTKFAMGLFVSAFAMACSAPGPGDTGDGGAANDAAPAPGNCTITLSGAVTATSGCSVAAADDDQGLHFGVASTDGKFAFASNLPGSALTTGTFALGATTKTVGTVAQGTAVWAEFYQDGQHPDQGDATFEVSDVGQSYAGSSGTGWLGTHGTLTATLPAADQFASGTVTATVTF
ncbi:MAG TPA: hypothetical protein VGH28_29265 [Polyangiaceae bacterium]|jgi:hypothetical protein